MSIALVSICLLTYGFYKYRLVEQSDVFISKLKDNNRIDHISKDLAKVESYLNEFANSIALKTNVTPTLEAKVKNLEKNIYFDCIKSFQLYLSKNYSCDKKTCIFKDPNTNILQIIKPINKDIMVVMDINYLDFTNHIISSYDDAAMEVKLYLKGEGANLTVNEEIHQFSVMHNISNDISYW
jgi:hypothetical protein